MRGGESYELTISASHAMLGDQRPARIDIYRAGTAAAEVHCVGDDDSHWTRLIAIGHIRVPAGWRLAGLAAPDGRMWDGREVWRVPGPPWRKDLCWAGPSTPLILHAAGPRPGWLGPEIGPVTGPCQTITQAQAAADTWWLAEVAAEVTREEGNGQSSLFGQPGLFGGEA
jgi:hypothetical protein